MTTQIDLMQIERDKHSYVPEVQETFNNGGILQVKREFEFLISFLKLQEIHNVIEIGVCTGGTLFHWNKLATGKIIGVDIPPPRWTETQVKMRDESVKNMGENVHLLLRNSNSTHTVNAVKNILGEEEVGLLHIDGAHDYPSVQMDYELYSPFVRKNGFIIFHDTNNSKYHQQCKVGVWDVFNSIEGDKLNLIGNEHWGGIGVVFKGE
jgi:predicted O-methyltransferase YrrM